MEVGMKGHPSHAALVLILLTSPLVAQSKIRSGAVLQQPVQATNQMRAARAELFAVDPLAGLTITPSPGAPSLPSPSFEATGLSGASGAQNDAQGKIVRTNLGPTGAELQACPLTPMFSFGPSGPTVPAAPFYLDTPNTAPAYQKYTFISGSLYFRPPAVPDAAFPGGLPSPQGAKNSWVYVANCRGEYSNAQAFRLEPTKYQITKVWPDGFIGGQQLVVSGTGLEGRKACSSTDWCAPTQKVMLHFRVVRVNSAGTAEYMERDIEAPLWNGTSGLDERSVAVFAPSIEALGYSRPVWQLVESTLYVLKAGVRSNDLPARYCSATGNPASTGSCW
jgi:hypothetical protein